MSKEEVRPLTDAESAHVADDKGRVFAVPKEHARAIINAVQGLRFSFEHLGGKHLGKAAKGLDPLWVASIGGKTHAPAKKES